ncbi:MAG TPA: hypothetical protein VF746_31470 [Longimicrobium sp.]|jgi:molybdopterin-guanine dinucleotide biosynthesis protein A
MPDHARVRIVSVRRRSPVSLSVRERVESAAADPVLEVLADARPLVTIPTAGARAAALRTLLSGPAWLLVVAADVHAELVARVWALVPAQEAGRELHEDELVYAIPLGFVRRPGPSRAHPTDLVAEARHLLGVLAPGGGP